MIDNLKVVTVVIIIIILGVSFAIFIDFENNSFNENNKSSISNNEKSYILENYDEYQKYFHVNEDGETILKVVDFNTFIDGTYYSSWHVNDDFDLCLGYYLIDKQKDGSIIIDDSHVCDYID